MGCIVSMHEWWTKYYVHQSVKKILPKSLNKNFTASWQKSWLITIRREFLQEENIEELMENSTLLKVIPPDCHQYQFWELLKSGKLVLVANLLSSALKVEVVSALKHNLQLYAMWRWVRQDSISVMQSGDETALKYIFRSVTHKNKITFH